MLDVVGDMPSVSPVAETIAQKLENEKAQNTPAPIQPEKPKKRGPGRPRKDGSAPQPKKSSNQSRLGGAASAEQRHNAAQDAERIATASFVTDMIEVSGVAIAGEDAAMSEHEKLGMVGCWDKYFAAKGINDIPPGVAITLVMSQYYIRVFTSPKAKPKTKKAIDWFKHKFSFIKGIKYARSLRGDDRQRENDTGKTTSESVQKQGD